MVTVAYVLATIAGLAAWLPATRLYLASRSARILGWALHFVLVITLATAAVAMAIGFDQGGLLGVAIGLGVGGLFALTMSVFAWIQASAAKAADETLNAMFDANPAMAERFRQHWFFKRILRRRQGSRQG